MSTPAPAPALGHSLDISSTTPTSRESGTFGVSETSRVRGVVVVVMPALR